MIVFGDLLFLINFSMDFLCFYFSCLLLHRRLPTLRACAASVLGGIYSVVSLFITASQGAALALDVLVLVVMCLIVYCSKKMTVGRIFKAILLYFFVSALLGGLMTALFSLFNRLEIFMGNVQMEEGINVWIFSLLAIFGSVFTMKGARIFRSSAKREVVLEIVTERGTSRLRTLVDSGNLAVEPISEKAVVFATAESCANVLDDEFYSALSNDGNIENLPLSVASKIRFVPGKTIGGETLLPAIKFKNIRLISKKNEKDLDVYVAFLKVKSMGEYDAIISDETII